MNPAAEQRPTVVTVDRLSYTYPGSAPALVDVSFTVQAGSRVAVLGANGAGKSTLLLHLAGILPGTPATSGRRAAVAADGTPASADGPAVTIAGLALIARNLPQIRLQVGLVFQNPDDQLFCPTVYDDVAFGPRNLGLSAAEVDRRVVDSLAQVGLGDWYAGAGAGAGSGQAGGVRRNPLRLSVGQKKRVALAAVLAMQPAVVALDEPTSNLDPRGAAEIARLLAALPATQIVVTHDLALVSALCDEAILLARGRVLTRGAAAAVVADRAALRAAELI